MAKHRKHKANHSTQPGIPVVAAATGAQAPVVGRTLSYPRTMPQPAIPARQRFAWEKLFKRLILTLVVMVVITGGWLGWKFYENEVKITGDKNPLHLLSIFNQQPLKGEDQGRVNILIAGDSADDPGHSGAQLTDSIMILSVNTKNHTAFMLSIPRDTWVDLPGWDHEKINAANEVTSFSQPGLPKGGMGELEQVIEQDLGIPIDYYALIDYTAFRDAVNAVGGIDVNIQSSDPRGLYDPNISVADGGPLRLPNGVQHLNGQTALNLARARGDAYGSYGFPRADFDRTQHQRQMLLALRSKATSAGVLSNPLKLGQLADSIGNNVQTDLQLNNMERFYSLTKNLNDSNIQSLSLDKINNQTLLKSYSAPNGQSALIPTAGLDNFTQIQAVIAQLLVVNQQ